MEKRIVYIAYLIIAFVIFNFMFDFSDKIRSWQLWNWYLVILLLAIGCLLFIKYKQNQRLYQLNEQVKETERCRLQLNQFLLLDQFEQLDWEKFNQFLERFFTLQGYDSIEIAVDRDKQGFDLLMWSNGEKSMLKWFRQAPMVTSLYTDALDNGFETGDSVTIQEMREAFGSKNDFNIQADKLILLSTNHFNEEALEFATRNRIVTINGEEFYHELEKLREPRTVATEALAR